MSGRTSRRRRKAFRAEAPLLTPRDRERILALTDGGVATITEAGGITTAFRHGGPSGAARLVREPRIVAAPRSDGAGFVGSFTSTEELGPPWREQLSGSYSASVIMRGPGFDGQEQENAYFEAPPVTSSYEVTVRVSQRELVQAPTPNAIPLAVFEELRAQMQVAADRIIERLDIEPNWKFRNAWGRLSDVVGGQPLSATTALRQAIFTAYLSRVAAPVDGVHEYVLRMLWHRSGLA